MACFGADADSQARFFKKLGSRFLWRSCRFILGIGLRVSQEVGPYRPSEMYRLNYPLSALHPKPQVQIPPNQVAKRLAPPTSGPRGDYRGLGFTDVPTGPCIHS